MHRKLSRCGVGLVGWWVAAAVLVGLLLVSGASAAKAHQTVAITVTVTGNGIVALPTANARFGCGGSRTCRHTFHVGRGRRVELTAWPEKTWKLTRWGGACKGTAQTCSLGRVRGRRSVKLRFVPPGTRLNPYPLGTAVGMASGWKMTVNYAIINADSMVQALDPPPPAGTQYVLVNLSMKNLGFGGPTSLPFAEGESNAPYTPDACTPPSPDLRSSANVGPGQTTTGNTCYRIASRDAGTLLLEGETFGGGGGPPGTVWFALRTKNRVLVGSDVRRTRSVGGGLPSGGQLTRVTGATWPAD